MEPTKQYTIHITQNTHEAIKRESDRTGIKIQRLVTDALKKVFENPETKD